MKRFKLPIKESILSATVEFDTSNPSDEDILRIAISAEESAVNLYNQLATYAQDIQLRKVLLDIVKEERIHIGEFQAVLYNLDPEEYDLHMAGEKEVNDV